MKTWAHSNRLGVVLLGALLVACIVAYERERARHSYVVSLINLLTDPQRYIDDRVVVKGYLEDYHGLTLFLTKEHADAGDHLSAVHVSDPTYEGVLTQSSCVGSFAEVRGTFRLYQAIPLLVDVVRVRKTHEVDPCWVPISGND